MYLIIFSHSEHQLQKNDFRTGSILAGAAVSFSLFPEKLNPVIRPLMDSIKKEENEQIQVCC